MVAMGPQSAVPVIGASGAIAGVLGAYFVLYPRGRIMTILPIFVIELVEIPAIFYLLAWFGCQFYAGIRAGAQGPLVGGVAWWAHVGGFLFGVAVAPLLAPRRATSDLAPPLKSSPQSVYRDREPIFAPASVGEIPSIIGSFLRSVDNSNPLDFGNLWMQSLEPYASVDTVDKADSYAA